jgi:hypothetical protein
LSITTSVRILPFEGLRIGESIPVHQLPHPATKAGFCFEAKPAVEDQPGQRPHCQPAIAGVLDRTDYGRFWRFNNTNCFVRFLQGKMQPEAKREFVSPYNVVSKPLVRAMVVLQWLPPVSILGRFIAFTCPLCQHGMQPGGSPAATPKANGFTAARLYLDNLSGGIAGSIMQGEYG